MAVPRQLPLGSQAFTALPSGSLSRSLRAWQGAHRPHRRDPERESGTLPHPPQKNLALDARNRSNRHRLANHATACTTLMVTTPNCLPATRPWVLKLLVCEGCFTYLHTTCTEICSFGPACGRLASSSGDVALHGNVDCCLTIDPLEGITANRAACVAICSDPMHAARNTPDAAMRRLRAGLLACCRLARWLPPCPSSV